MFYNSSPLSQKPFGNLAMLKRQFTLQHFRDRLAHYEALPQLAVLGLISGIGVGLLMVLFRLAVDWPLTQWLGAPENFEALTSSERLGWPLAGSIILIILFYLWPITFRQVGMIHLFERLAYHQGNIPVRSLIMQFTAAATALISGHSVGREGPAIFLGAAASSQIGQILKLPNNSMRLLIGCGTAAAISAAFNTPLAGVIFAMEVILLEYTLIGFTPIIVSAVTADLVMRSALGHHNVFDVPLFEIATLAEIPWIMLLGVCVGGCAAAFNYLQLKTYKLNHWPVFIRFTLAALLTGTAALFYPQLMGVGYDTISEALWGRLDLSLIAALLIIKLIITPVILGLGIPAGLIAPTLFIGALLGAVFGTLGALISNMDVSHLGLYAMLGMGAMMGAVLNAPLAALAALLELTGNPNIIFPGMIAIVISNLTVRYLFNQPSIFLSAMQAQGLDYRQEPLAQALSRAAVGSLMERQFALISTILSAEAARSLCTSQTRWLIIKEVDQPASAVMPTTDLKDYLDRNPELTSLNLQEIPAQRTSIHPVSFRATLHEALNNMEENHTDLLCVLSNQDEIMGLLSRGKIEYYYSHKQTI